MKKHLLYIVAVSLMAFVGCQEKSNVEKTGERMDEVIDNVSEGENPLKKKGTMEKMGESVDESMKTEGN